MTLGEGIKNTGSPFVIDRNSRSELPQFLKDRGYEVGAEIGVYKGEFTVEFCKVGLYMYAIDPWKVYYLEQKQERQDFLYSHAQRVLEPYQNKRIIRASSRDALSEFHDESLDFVYIDGDHSFARVAEDIYEWSKKVRKGGIVSGHDYSTRSEHCLPAIKDVGPVVDAYTKAFGIKNWYVFGTRNKAASFMWIKE